MRACYVKKYGLQDLFYSQRLYDRSFLLSNLFLGTPAPVGMVQKDMAMDLFVLNHGRSKPAQFGPNSLGSMS